MSTCTGDSIKEQSPTIPNGNAITNAEFKSDDVLNQIKYLVNTDAADTRGLLEDVYRVLVNKRKPSKLRAQIASWLAHLKSEDSILTTLTVLTELLRDRSPEVVAASVDTMGEFLFRLGVSPEQRTETIKLIEDLCTSRTWRNRKVVLPFYSKGREIFQPVRVDEVAYSVLYRYGRFHERVRQQDPESHPHGDN